MSTIVALPSAHPGGLESVLSSHFGHCDVFTLVTLEDAQIGEVKTVPNVSHRQGWCMAPIDILAQSGVKVLIAGGMGSRPLLGFNSVDIRVFHSGGATRVGQAVKALLENRLQPFLPGHACSSSAHGPAHKKGACGVGD